MFSKYCLGLFLCISSFLPIAIAFPLILLYNNLTDMSTKNFANFITILLFLKKVKAMKKQKQPINKTTYEWHTHAMKNHPVMFNYGTMKASPNRYTNIHENVEFLLFQKGDARVRCENRYIEAEYGDIVCVNSHVSHCVETSTYTSHYCLIVDSDFCRENNLDPTVITFADKIHDEKASALYLAVGEAYRLQSPFASAALRGATLSFISYLAMHYCALKKSAQSKPVPQNILDTVNYMKANLDTKLTLETLANAGGLSCYHFARTFKKVTHHSPLAYLNILRMEKATHMLHETTLSIADISAACGFESPSYFARSFRAFTGLSPTEYRTEQSNYAHL